ncbi:hypothetical protein [Streptomyces sp. TLI_105]|uniref:hypothetical protein n=1 Tax=Streptomyces sp. TLI_105 TaxID=1881019 RepID=UPI00089845BC|nr:hypothetical protein [Streptomyces sp. TLI_105]SEE59916.1 hypothetical protein SAMN05428939_8067 [Streptomyces sp. TLI_105]
MQTVPEGPCRNEARSAADAVKLATVVLVCTVVVIGAGSSGNQVRQRGPAGATAAVAGTQVPTTAS